MARPSLIRERREQMLAAFEQLIVQRGLSYASMGKVAEVVGIDRSTAHHYFKTRQGLLVSLTERILASYQTRLDEKLRGAAHEDRLDLAVDHLFSPEFSQRSYSIILDELIVAGRQDSGILEHVVRVYQALEDELLGALEKACPHVAPRVRRRTGYALAALAEGASVLTGLGFSSERRLAARDAARQLVANLRER